MGMADTVSVLIPLKAEYVSIARLAASGVANRIGFDFDTIEDIKVVLSEILGRIIGKKPSDERITIDFVPTGDGLKIKFNLSDNNISNIFDNEDSLAWAIVSSLMDEIDMQKNGHTVMTTTKKLGKAVSDEQSN